MPYSGPNDDKLPDNIKSLPESERSRWVSIWNDTFDRCTSDGGSDCEQKAFRNANGVVLSSNLSLVGNARISGQVRETVFDGRSYLVAPIVAVKESVLNGEFVPAEEIGIYPEAWNGTIIPIGHPTRNGEYISANTPDIVESQVIGNFYNAVFEDEKLKGEIWIDLQKAERIGGKAMDVVRNLMSDTPEIMEVSTAYFRELEEKGGTFNGVKYSSIARNIRPDHIAILPDEIGACSVEAGCGVPRINKDMAANPGMEGEESPAPKEPSFSGVETKDWDEVDLSLESYIAGFFRHSDRADTSTNNDALQQVSDLTPEIRFWISSKSILGKPNSNSLSEMAPLPVVNPLTDHLNQEGVRRSIPAADTLDMDPGLIREAQNMARNLLKEHFGEDVQGNPYTIGKPDDPAKEPQGDQRMGQAIWSGASAPFFIVADPRNNSVNWNSINWNDMIDPNSINWNSINWNSINWNELLNRNSINWNRNFDPNSVNWNSINWNNVPVMMPVSPDVDPNSINWNSAVAANSSDDGEDQEVSFTVIPLAAMSEEPCNSPSANSQSTEIPDDLVELVSWAKSGGLEQLKSLTADLQANADREKKSIIDQIVANESTQFTAKELSRFDMETLRKLHRSLQPRDYSPNGVPVTNRSADEWEELSTPWREHINN